VILEQMMPVNLSIKNAPDAVVERLRERAQRNHRSLQGELMAIIEEAVRPSSYLTPVEFLAEIRKLGLRSPSEAADLVRVDRDHGHRDH
jgi:antitoxin FitA